MQLQNRFTPVFGLTLRIIGLWPNRMQSLVAVKGRRNFFVPFFRVEHARLSVQVLGGYQVPRHIAGRGIYVHSDAGKDFWMSRTL